MKKIQIADQWIGEEESVFIVVEVGTTSNGDVETAFRLIDAAKYAGANAIKFMIINADYFMSNKSVTYEYEYQGGKRNENMYEMFKNLEFTKEEWLQIRDYCKEKEITFFATVDYIPGIDLAEELHVAAYKSSSWDACNFPLLEKMAHTQKPVVVDLGPTKLCDIDILIDKIRMTGNDQIALLHCSHAKEDHEINIRSIPFLQDVFQIPVGYSADSRDFVPDISAVALGTHMLEKRLTLNKNFEGHHHIKALEPEEFKEYVNMIRYAERIRGKYTVKPSTEDLRQKKLYYVSITANEDIPAGTIIQKEMVCCKRPGTGISPEMMDTIVGRTAQRDIHRDELLDWNAI